MLLMLMHTNVGSFFYFGNCEDSIILVLLVCPCRKMICQYYFLSLNCRNGAKMERWIVHLMNAHRLYKFPPYHNGRFCVFSVCDGGFPELLV
jgi:hypothetical protein